MKLQLTDPCFNSPSSYGVFDKFLLKFIRDERDLPFLFLSMRILLLVIPVSVFLFLHFSWWLAIPFLLFNIATGLGPFILMLHNTSHRKLFKEEYRYMNHFIPWILGPFYGETPETYFSHHIIMHHAENNLINDLSCTLNYQRDRFIDFIKYFLIFFVLGMVDLTYYLKRKNRWKFIRKVVLGEIGFFIICGILWQFNWAATLTVFVLPFFIARFGMMAGNWAQHGFIGTDPASPYTNSITCINCTYNRTCFNDGYHIGHHLRPNMHWTDMPAELSNNIERYKSNGAIVFQGIDFFVIWFLLMTKNYRKLSKHYVDIRQEFTTQEEIIAMLKERVKRFNMKRIHPNANVIFNSIC